MGSSPGWQPWGCRVWRQRPAGLGGRRLRLAPSAPGTNRSFLLLGLLLAPGPHRGQSPTQGHRRSTPARDSRGRMSVGRVQAEGTGGPWVGGATYLGHITAQPDHKTVNKVWARSPAGLENRDPGLARDETGSLPQGAWAGRLALRPRAPHRCLAWGFPQYYPAGRWGPSWTWGLRTRTSPLERQRDQAWPAQPVLTTGPRRPPQKPEP